MTPKMKEAFDFIALRIKETGCAPSYQEMADMLGVSSKSGIHRIILAFEDRGKIMRLPNKARAIILAEDVKPTEAQAYKQAVLRARKVCKLLADGNISRRQAAIKLKEALFV